jgi:hypothetical protein
MPINIYDRDNFGVSLDSTIWRYMDIGKYLDLITRQQMWFARAITFRKTDPYEGTLTQSDRDTMVRVLGATTKDDLRAILPNWSHLISNTPTKSLYWLQAIFLHKVGFLDHNVYSNSISCWHENASESDAMWALYAQRDAGIAIRSTISRALNAFVSSPRSMCIGKVNYASTVSPLSALVVQLKQMIPALPFSSPPRKRGSRAASLVPGGLEPALSRP